MHSSCILTIDLNQAYFQIPLAKKNRKITAFSISGKELYHFTRMSYDLTGAPATFQRLLNHLISPEMKPFAFAYLNNIVIVIPTFEKDMVLDKITSVGLTVNPNKCKFCRSQVHYLGFIMQGERLIVNHLIL